MKQKEVRHPVDKKRVIFALFLSVLTFFLLLGFSFLHKRQELPFIDSEIEVNGTRLDPGSVYSVKSGETAAYVIKSVPEPEGPNPVLFFHTSNTFWDLKVDGRSLDSYSERDVRKGWTIGRRWNMCFLPPNAVGSPVEIDFRVADCVKQANLPTNIYFSGYRKMMSIFTGMLVPALVMIACIGILSIIYVVLSETVLARMGENHVLSGLGVSGLTMSIWMLAQNETTGFLFGYSYNLISADYMSFLNMQGLLLQAFILYVTNNQEKTMAFRWFETFIPAPYFVGSVIMYNLDVRHIVPYESSVLVSTITLIAMAVFMLAVSIALLFSKKHRFSLLEVLLYYGVYLLFISAVVDQVLDRFYATTDHSAYTRVSLLIFLIVVGSYEIYSFFMYWREAQEAKVESKLAYVDGLTGIANRMAFNDAFDRLQESPVSAAIISLDVNRLKGTNDTFGHLEGDKLIRIAASSIKEAFEDIGTAYRYGGDEFMVLIPNYSRISVEKACNKLEAIERRVNADGVLPDGISVAYGVARYDAAKDHTLEDTMRRADSAMYAVKKRQEGME